MQFGGPLPWTGPLASAENLVRAATEAERQGYGWVTAGDHLLYPKAMRARHPRTGARLSIDVTSASHEIFTMFSWLAAQTSTLRFMTSMLIVPYRTPFVTAKLVAGLDYFSGGRLILGAAAGWMFDEFEMLNLPFAERGHLTDEYLEILTGLLSGEDSFAGRYFSHPEVWLAPKPDRAVPIVIGGGAVGPVLRRAARYGAGWWPFPMSAAQIAEALPRFRAAWQEAGRSGVAPEIHAFGRIQLDENGRRLTSEDDAITQVAALRDAGVTHLSMDFSEHGGDAGSVPLAAVLDASDWFAREIAPHFGD